MRVLACHVRSGSNEKCGLSKAAAHPDRAGRGAGDAFDGAAGASGHSVIALRPDLEVVPAAQLVDFFWWPHDFGNVALDVRGIPPKAVVAAGVNPRFFAGRLAKRRRGRYAIGRYSRACVPVNWG